MYATKNMQLLFFLTCLLAPEYVLCHKSFVVSFQAQKNGIYSPSTDEWIEYLKDLSPAKEFTFCHWIKPSFFNEDTSANTGAYCFMQTAKDNIECMQTFFHADPESANRNVIFYGEIGWNKKYVIFSRPIKPFPHRSWVHFCWSFSSISGESKLYYNGNLLGSDTVNDADNDTLIKGKNEVFDAAFVFGQEPDSMRGGYDKTQTFFGDLAEFNLWSYIVDDKQINDMGHCKDWTQGNMVAWKKVNWETNNVVLNYIEDAPSICSELHNLVIFPQKVAYSQAVEICALHGGKMALPSSETENDEILKIVSKHNEKCIEPEETETGRAVWLGATYENQAWRQTKPGGSPGNLISYTNWSSYAPSTHDRCAYMQKDGRWQKGQQTVCSWKTSCTICSIPNTPVFTLKGMCDFSEADWNYYLALDNTNAVEFLEGYKMSNIVKSNNHQEWTFSGKIHRLKETGGTLLANGTLENYPLGRKNWLVNQTRCGLTNHMKTVVISGCNTGSEFSCDSGACVNLSKRCDEKKDCLDGSDEKYCSLVSIPVWYKKRNPPDQKIPNTSLDIHTQMTIINIDYINTFDMMVGLTIKIRMKWYDGRLTYWNPSVNEVNIISTDVGRQIWLPLDNLVHDNAVIGEVKYDNQKRILLHPGTPADADVALPIENRIFSGSNSMLDVSQRMKIKYNCIFNVKIFPFDEEECIFLISILQNTGTIIRFVEDETIVYSGPSIVDQFRVGPIRSKINHTDHHAQFIFVIPMRRIFTNQLLKTFFPILLLWLFGYMTLFIDIGKSSDRFMGAGTSLLVIATLLNAINADIPKTSYLKLIDLWFLWHILNTFAIIAYHIVLDRMRKELRQSDVIDTKVFYLRRVKDNDDAIEVPRSSKIIRMNYLAILIFPLLNGIFYAVYFFLNFQ